MRSKNKIRQSIGIVLSVLMLAFHYSPQMQTLRALPQTLQLRAGQQHALSLEWPMSIAVEEGHVQVISSKDETLADLSERGVYIEASEQGSAKLSVSVLGLPIRQVDLQVAPQRVLIPGGHAIGVALMTQGVLVVGMSDIAGNQNGSPARLAGLKPGDLIEAVNGVRVESARHLSDLINQASGAQITVQLQRKDQTQNAVIQPILDRLDDKYRLGIWVRDSTAGVGTLSFFDPQTGKYGALGHAITDMDTGANLTVREGRVLYSTVVDIQKGMRGQPGELHGSFLREQHAFGDITRNNGFGIYGFCSEKPTNPLYSNGLPVGGQAGVHTGSASILTTLDNRGIREYGIEITRVNRQNAPSAKSMTLRVTDPELLARTGGIVQGMSGSPILQDGRIIGAVTHVYVNDPTQGYGLFIEWMLDQADAA